MSNSIKIKRRLFLKKSAAASMVFTTAGLNVYATAASALCAHVAGGHVYREIICWSVNPTVSGSDCNVYCKLSSDSNWTECGSGLEIGEHSYCMHPDTTGTCPEGTNTLPSGCATAIGDAECQKIAHCTTSTTVGGNPARLIRVGVYECDAPDGTCWS